MFGLCFSCTIIIPAIIARAPICLRANSGKVDGVCTRFGLNRVQSRENNSAFCTIFDLIHVQNAGKLTGSVLSLRCVARGSHLIFS
ncbi:hypothetical protein HMPREF1576_01048 [Gardnerella pickettii JCP7719]|uniref:Uncharacterized protein n=1 Tax=Gardnerella pickettii JCP7719 TaxID=1261061 RepID=S4H324_9BIFI|nr:hypothetical protein HMPREF1576_01048 [Gardnerella pickettii JCP7719]